MNQTPNYQLSQWEASDRIQRTDFNADNAKIDAALAAHARTLAEHSAAIPKIVVGSYHGDGAESQSISVGFTPKMVLVIPTHGNMYASGVSGGIFGGLAVSGSPTVYSNYNAVEIIGGGFRVMYKNIDTYSKVATNHGNLTYNYIAIG